MNSLRAQIRSILREELSALRSGAPAPAVHAVRIESDSDVLDFARMLLARAQEPGFAEEVRAGRVRFALERAHRVAPMFSHGSQTSSAPQNPPCLDKQLITEKDLAAVPSGQRVLRVGRHCRLTPLAQDEARRRGIRIERNTP